MSRLRERLLALLAGRGDERPSAVKEPAPVMLREEKDNAPLTSPNTCPNCGSNLFVEITATVKRCAQCGHQGVAQPKRAAVPPIIGKRATPPDTCPSCGCGPLQKVGDGAGEWRCPACGGQSAAAVGNGLSRADLDHYTGLRADQQMNPVGFFRAIARAGGFGSR